MIQTYLDKQFQGWLDKRIPSQHEVELNQRRIFIFPTRQTFYILAVIILLLVAGINYQNNLAYALAFFIASIFNTSIIITYLNVSKLRIKAGKSSSVYAGESAEFEVEISRLPLKTHHRIHIYWPDNPRQVHDLVRLDRKKIRLHCLTKKRGVFKPGRFIIESFYPLGLIRCWSWVDLDMSVVIYPKPVTLVTVPSAIVQGNAGKESPVIGKEDFYGFKTYISGDPLRHVDWRSVAKGQELQSKVYAAQQDENNWVDWYELHLNSTEEKLSRMCDWVLQLERQSRAYGLRLPNIEIKPDFGELHKKRVLTELALYDLPSAPVK